MLGPWYYTLHPDRLSLPFNYYHIALTTSTPISTYSLILDRCAQFLLT